MDLKDKFEAGLAPNEALEEEIKQHREKGAKDQAAHGEEIAHLIADLETVQTQLATGREEVCLAAAHFVEHGLTVVQLEELETSRVRQQEEANLRARAQAEVAEL